MVNYKPNGDTKNKGVLIVTIVFAVIGLICLIIGYNNKIVYWLKTFGVVTLLLASPILAYLIFDFIIKKIKDM